MAIAIYMQQSCGHPFIAVAGERSSHQRQHQRDARTACYGTACSPLCSSVRDKTRFCIHGAAVVCAVFCSGCSLLAWWRRPKRDIRQSGRTVGAILWRKHCPPCATRCASADDVLPLIDGPNTEDSVGPGPQDASKSTPDAMAEVEAEYMVEQELRKRRIQLRDAVRAELKEELEEDVWLLLWDALKDETLEELKDELEDDVRGQLRDEFRLEAGLDIEVDSDGDGEDELDNELVDDADEEVLHDDEIRQFRMDLGGLDDLSRRIRSELRAELAAEVRADLVKELYEDVREELREDRTPVARQQLRRELEEEVRRDLAWELGTLE